MQFHECYLLHFEYEVCVWGKMCIWIMSKTVCNKTRLSSLFINYLAFGVSFVGLTVAILWKSGTNPTILYELRQTSCFGSYMYLLLTSQKSNEVNWKAIKSIPWAVHDLPNWHDLKSKLISKLRQNTVSNWLVRNSKSLFLIFLLASCFNFVILHCFVSYMNDCWMFLNSYLN